MFLVLPISVYDASPRRPFRMVRSHLDLVLDKTLFVFDGHYHRRLPLGRLTVWAHLWG